MVEFRRTLVVTTMQAREHWRRIASPVSIEMLTADSDILMRIRRVTQELDTITLELAHRDGISTVARDCVLGSLVNPPTLVFVTFGDRTTLEHLKPHLSHSNDEVFVEAAWTASVLTWRGCYSIHLPQPFTLTIIHPSSSP